MKLQTKIEAGNRTIILREMLVLGLRNISCMETVDQPFKESWNSCKIFANYQLIADFHIRFLYQVYFWVCNDEEEFAQCNKLGGTGCMTDRPTLLREYLNAKLTE